MRIPAVQQLRDWDAYTILHEPVSSAALMERAATQCSNWILTHIRATHFCIIAGTGNNGGDGLAIARMLFMAGKTVRVIVVGSVKKGSVDFLHNLKLLGETASLSIFFHNNIPKSFHFEPQEWIIDALLGSGLNKPLEGEYLQWVMAISPFANRTISIDLPSGFNGDLLIPQQGAIVRAAYTLTFQVPKRAFFFPENEIFTGKIAVLDIGLHAQFPSRFEDRIQVIIPGEEISIVQRRKKSAYKNQFGHLQIIAGSNGKFGAAALCTLGAMRAGCGLATVNIPNNGVGALLSIIPEAMCMADKNNLHLQSTRADNTKSAIAIGSGIGQHSETSAMVRRVIKEAKIPIVFDADALNIIAEKKLSEHLPENSVITPHTGEFDRLFGKHSDTFERIATQQKKSTELGIVIVLKGAHTSVALPDGKLFFNSTGNPGMATAGSGDVLTGVIGSFLAQGYSPSGAAIAGTYLHGLSGDIIAARQGEAGMIASDIAGALPAAIQQTLQSISL
ncbi:MAG: NAD(P)H-hydrate dehydratase [Crocinitomicaceae bacterium]|nr:NAD(P)H-hydrate dehydratase [Crocinitomicaceae bacterium]